MERGRPTVDTPTADRALFIERVFDAPRELVWAALTERGHARQWWAPKGSSVTRLEMDVRPGGVWRKSMRSPDGQEVSNGGTYREVVRPERLAFTYAVHGYQTLVTLTLSEHGGKTKVTLHQAVFESIADGDSHRRGWTSTVERLGEYLSRRQQS